MLHIKQLAKKWLIEHKHNEVESSFNEDLSSLVKMIDEIRDHEGLVVSDNEFGSMYDSTFGDDRECKCGHSYYRHFDSYDDMAPVGCKYCYHYGPIHGKDCHDDDHCTGFKEKEREK